jgi:hypothetical protein
VHCIRMFSVAPELAELRTALGTATVRVSAMLADYRYLMPSFVDEIRADGVLVRVSTELTITGCTLKRLREMRRNAQQIRLKYSRVPVVDVVQ